MTNIIVILSTIVPFLVIAGLLMRAIKEQREFVGAGAPMCFEYAIGVLSKTWRDLGTSFGNCSDDVCEVAGVTFCKTAYNAAMEDINMSHDTPYEVVSMSRSNHYVAEEAAERLIEAQEEAAQKVAEFEFWYSMGTRADSACSMCGDPRCHAFECQEKHIDDDVWMSQR